MASTLVLIHTADLHGSRSGIELASRLVRRLAGALWLDSGDAVPAPNISLGLGARPTLERMSKGGCAAMALGNREFELWAGPLCRKLRSARFPVICTNLAHPQLPALPVVSDASVVASGGNRVRIYGLLRDMTASVPAKFVSRFRFHEPASALRNALADVPEDETVVVLSHLGEAADRELLASIERVDVVLGGHDHRPWLHTVAPRAACAPAPKGRTVTVAAGIRKSAIRLWSVTHATEEKCVAEIEAWGTSAGTVQ